MLGRAIPSTSMTCVSGPMHSILLATSPRFRMLSVLLSVTSSSQTLSSEDFFGYHLMALCQVFLPVFSHPRSAHCTNSLMRTGLENTSLMPIFISSASNSMSATQTSFYSLTATSIWNFPIILPINSSHLSSHSYTRRLLLTLHIWLHF